MKEEKWEYIHYRYFKKQQYILPQIPQIDTEG